MSQGVVRLKELLFDNESQTLSELQRRLDHLTTLNREGSEKLSNEVAELASREAGYRLELTQRLDEVFSRAGTLKRFQSSVSDVLDAALRDAEVERHGQLSEAIAPLVTKTIKTEIHNSQDDLVEALYPMTGRMVQAYVASAIKDMMSEINRRIEYNPVSLRLRSLTTGRSVAELALAESQRLDVEEIYLIRRGTGELVDRWPADSEGSNRDHMMSGVLTAINEFATEAFNVKGSAMRRLDVDDDQVYLRVSPSYLLAAKCKGTAHRSVEKIIDEEFLIALEKNVNRDEPQSDGTTDSDGAETDQQKPLAALAERLEGRIAARQEKLRKTAFNPAKFLLWLIVLGLAAWFGWTAYQTYLTEQTRATALSVIERNAALEGYPIDLTVEPYGEAMSVRGLTPSTAAKTNLLNDLEKALPNVEVSNGLTVVASADAKIQPEVDQLRRDVTGLSKAVPTEVSQLRAELRALRESVAREAVSRAMTRASGRLTGIAPDLDRLAANLTDATATQKARAVSNNIAAISSTLVAQNNATEPAMGTLSSTIADATQSIEQATRNLAGLVDQALAEAARNRAQAATADTAKEPSQSAIARQAETLALKSEQFATLVVAINQAANVKPAPIEQTERERLESFARSNAVFFSNATTYRNPSQATATLKSLVDLAREGSLLIRIVGYTDEQGTRQANVVLAQQRADAVYEDLISMGMPRNRIVAVGRADGSTLANNTGENSPNRRVQFEVGFAGEAVPRFNP